MQEKLEKLSLQKISVNTNELVWVEKGKEVLLNGKLFDVNSLEILNGRIILTGLFDTEEDAIAKKISALENNKNDSSSPVYSLLVKLFCPVILQQNNPIVITDSLPENDKFPASLCTKFDNPFIAVNTHPPKQLTLISI